MQVMTASRDSPRDARQAPRKRNPRRLSPRRDSSHAMRDRHRPPWRRVRAARMYRRPRLARPFPPSAWRPPSGTRTRCPPAARGLSPRRPPRAKPTAITKSMMPETRKPTAKLESALSSSPSGWTISLTRSMMIVWMPCTTCSAAPALMVMTMRRSRQRTSRRSNAERSPSLEKCQRASVMSSLPAAVGLWRWRRVHRNRENSSKTFRDCTGRRGSPRQPTARRCCCFR